MTENTNKTYYVEILSGWMFEDNNNGKSRINVYSDNRYETLIESVNFRRDIDG